MVYISNMTFLSAFKANFIIATIMKSTTTMPKAKKPKYTPPEPAPYAPIHQLYDDAIEFRRQNPTESWEKIATRFTVNKDTLRRRFNGGGTKAASGGHNKLFSDEEELGIIAIINRYTFIRTPLRLDLLRGVAI
jgi:DNA invertase Pin-like site-specific DNA recombinase